MNYLKAVLINLWIVTVACGVMLIARLLDAPLGLLNYQSFLSISIGTTLIFIGLFFRLWASMTFYKNKLNVVRLKSQHKFIQSGPYQFSRNPLYIGLVTIVLGFALISGSLLGLILAILHFFLWDFWLRFFEEKDLEKAFGEEYLLYKKKFRVGSKLTYAEKL